MASIPLTTARPADHGPAVSVGQQQADQLLPELLILAVASSLALILYWAESYRLLCIAIPLLLIVVNAVANFRMIVRDSAMLLTPLFGARLCALVVFGIGGLFNAFAPDVVRIGQDYSYPLTVSEAAKVNVLWLLGMTLLILGFVAGMRFHRGRQGEADRGSALASLPMNVGMWLFATSIAAFLLTTWAKFVLPGVLLNLMLACELCGLFLISQHVGTSLTARVALVGGLAGLFMLALLFAAKTLFLYPALIAAMGILSNRVTWIRALLGAALVLSGFFLLAPAVGYMRQRSTLENGAVDSSSLGDRVRYLRDYVAGDRAADDENQYTMSRLDYVMPAAFVMAQFEQGMASDRLITAGYIFIPRMIWPDKPMTTGSGLEVNHAMGSQGDNQIGTTIFADLYWNIGWFGLALVPLLGIYFGLVSIMCRAAFLRGDWVLLPFALASTRLGLNLDSDFTAGIMAPAVINIVLFLALRVISRFARELGAPHRQQEANPASPFPDGAGRGGA